MTRHRETSWRQVQRSDGGVDAPSESSDTHNLEQLPARNADVVLVVRYAGEQWQPDPGTEAILESPLYRRLPR